MSFCIPYSEYLLNPDLYEIESGPGESCEACSDFFVPSGQDVRIRALPRQGDSFGLSLVFSNVVSEGFINLENLFGKNFTSPANETFESSNIRRINIISDSFSFSGPLRVEFTLPQGMTMEEFSQYIVIGEKFGIPENITVYADYDQRLLVGEFQSLGMFKKMAMGAAEVAAGKNTGTTTTCPSGCEKVSFSLLCSTEFPRRCKPEGWWFNFCCCELCEGYTQSNCLCVEKYLCCPVRGNGRVDFIETDEQACDDAIKKLDPDTKRRCCVFSDDTCPKARVVNTDGLHDVCYCCPEGTKAEIGPESACICAEKCPAPVSDEDPDAKYRIMYHPNKSEFATDPATGYSTPSIQDCTKCYCVGWDEQPLDKRGGGQCGNREKRSPTYKNDCSCLCDPDVCKNEANHYGYNEQRYKLTQYPNERPGGYGCNCECIGKIGTDEYCPAKKINNSKCDCVCDDSLCVSPKIIIDLDTCECVCAKLGGECNTNQIRNQETCECECTEDPCPNPDKQTRNQDTCECDEGPCPNPNEMRNPDTCDCPCPKVTFGGKEYDGSISDGVCKYDVECFECGQNGDCRSVDADLTKEQIEAKSNCSDWSVEGKDRYNTQDDCYNQCCVNAGRKLCDITGDFIDSEICCPANEECIDGQCCEPCGGKCCKANEECINDVCSCKCVWYTINTCPGPTCRWWGPGPGGWNGCECYCGDPDLLCPLPYYGGQVCTAPSCN